MDKAIIEGKIDKYKYKVRIPRYDKALSVNKSADDSSLLTAQVCTMPGLSPVYNTGDVVWVDYETGLLNKPVIIGLFSRKDLPSSTEGSFINQNDMNLQQLNTVVRGILETLNKLSM